MVKLMKQNRNPACPRCQVLLKKNPDDIIFDICFGRTTKKSIQTEQKTVLDEVIIPI